MADNKQISLLLRNLTLDFSVTHITNKPDISAFQTTSVNWYRSNIESRNETKTHGFHRYSPSVRVVPIIIAFVQFL